MTLIQIIPICISICAISLNLYFRYIDKKKKKLFYIIKNNLIIKNSKNIDKLVLTYENEKITQLVKTEVLIFNKSKRTIEFNELGKTEPLQLSFSENTNIFSVEIFEFNNPNLNFEIDQNKTSIKLNFDYLKNENYVLLNIISDENSLNKPEMLGEFIKDGEILRFNKSKFYFNELLRIIPSFLIGIILLSIFCKYLELRSEYGVILSLIFGYFIIDFVRFLFNKKIDKNILNIIRAN